MKYTSGLLLLLIIVALSSLPHLVYSICMDHDPKNLDRLLIVDCTPKKNDNDIGKNSFQLGDKLFQVNFICQIPDQVKCDKVEKTFNMAGDIISNSLNLNTPIIVSATFDTLDLSKLGGATPTRYISLLDKEDQVERFYPQALVKQFQIQLPVSYADSDITAEFNSLINWYTPDDKGPIGKDQYDLLYTVLHEMIHGLGFVSSWKGIDDINIDTTRELTPFIVTDSNDPTADIPDTPFKFHGFRETIFDKFIVSKDINGLQKRLSVFSNELNQFNTNATELAQFYAQFQSSSQYGAAEQVLKLSTTPHSLIFMPRGGKSITDDGVVLETKITPYQLGSSISHVDSLVYNVGNPDFLMRPKSVLGVTMDSLVAKGGDPTENPIGPKLLKILGSMGYNLTNSVKSSASKQSITIDFILIFQITLCIIFITRI